jgi:hypothetical protein
MTLAGRPWFTRSMRRYTFHWWSTNSGGTTAPLVTLVAQARSHGVAVALSQFVLLGWDHAAPLARSLTST